MKFKLGPIDFTQPSTWRGAAGIAALCGISVSPALTEQIAIALGAVLSAIELFRNEHAARTAPLPPLELHAQPTPFLDAALPHRRLRESLPPEPEPAAPAESSGFGDH
ncbi:MAG: hypothetical protein IT490_09225 [Candidatus Contendobacter sp.]|nr:hypothetical protein [Candidatus Contendobacter sp.]